MKADGNTNSNQTRWSQHTNPCHYRPPLRSFCASNSTSLLQRAQSALMLLCHHLAMLPCCHVIMFPCINIKYFKSTWNQCAWCLEARKPLCVKCMCGSERPNCVCVCVCVCCMPKKHSNSGKTCAAMVLLIHHITQHLNVGKLTHAVRHRKALKNKTTQGKQRKTLLRHGQEKTFKSNSKSKNNRSSSSC